VYVNREEEAMKVFVRLVMFICTAIVATLAVIKFTRRCSWSEAAAILDEFCQDMREACPCCSEKESEPDK
jgi:hypothetical protein